MKNLRGQFLFQLYRYYLLGLLKKHCSSVYHSIWNLLFFNLACFIGEIPYSSSCRILSSETYTDELGANITSLVISAALVLFTYLLYKRKVDSEEQKPLFSS